MSDERFWSKVDANGDCWEWLGARYKGYGRFTDGRRSVRAHRFAYESLVGRIPSDLVIDHLCRNRACVNPDHMEPVPNRINLLRGYGFAGLASNRTHCANGHPYDAVNTRVTPKGTRICRPCYAASRRRLNARKRALVFA